MLPAGSTTLIVYEDQLEWLRIVPATFHEGEVVYLSLANALAGCVFLYKEHIEAGGQPIQTIFNQARKLERISCILRTQATEWLMSQNKLLASSKSEVLRQAIDYVKLNNRVQDLKPIPRKPRGLNKKGLNVK